MVEKELVIDGLELNYTGLFKLSTLLRTIDELLAEKGYSKNEKHREERVRPSGKSFVMELRPTRTMSAYESVMVKMRITISDINEVEVIIDNKKRNVEQGTIHIIFDGWTSTDYEWRWEQKAWVWLLRGFFEKFFFKVKTRKFHSLLVEDTHHFYNNIKAHLNLHRFIFKEKK